MKAIQSGDVYVVFDEQSGIAVAVRADETAAQLAELEARIKAEDARLDEKRLLEWAKGAFMMSYEGQRVLEAEREAERLRGQLAAIKEAPTEKEAAFAVLEREVGSLTPEEKARVDAVLKGGLEMPAEKAR